MDQHCEMIMEEYRSNYDSFVKMRDITVATLKGFVKEIGMVVNGIEARVKEEKSLAGKLELKGHKYKTLADITDIMGARVITFYEDEVDKVAAMVENTFEVDWSDSVDKRALYDNDRFGYLSLHYICRIPESLYFDKEHPEINKYRFEIQMRTTLQHVWATIEHDTGYKTDVEIPKEYLRSFSRLAGLLELADEEFKRTRDGIEEYRNKVAKLIKNGNFEDMDLNADTFANYLEIEPFERLNKQIADINHAEIQQVNLMRYLPLLKMIGLKNLADVEQMKKDYGDAAYKLALHTYGHTDLDIISSALALQNLCIIYLIANGGKENELKAFYDEMLGEKPRNMGTAVRMLETVKNLNLIQA